MSKSCGTLFTTKPYPSTFFRFSSKGILFVVGFDVAIKPMELTAVVQFAGSRAHYTITRENVGIYQARLLKYEGGDWIYPPESVTLVRGARHWVGSTEEQCFVDQLGDVIEKRVRSGDPNSH